MQLRRYESRCHTETDEYFLFCMAMRITAAEGRSYLRVVRRSEMSKGDSINSNYNPCRKTLIRPVESCRFRLPAGSLRSLHLNSTVQLFDEIPDLFSFFSGFSTGLEGGKLNALQYEGFILNLKIRLLAFRFNETTIDDVGRR